MEQTTTEALPNETLTSSEEADNEEASESYAVIDYSPQLNRIETVFNEINEQLEMQDSVSYLEESGISFITGKVNNADIFSVLLMIVIMLGLIFGALVFRHFRK